MTTPYRIVRAWCGRAADAARRRAAVAGQAVAVALLLSLVSVSCQTTPRPSRTAAGAEPDVRVRIIREAPSVRIAGPARVALRPVGSFAEWTAATPIDVRAEAGVLVATDAAGVERRFDQGAPLEVRAVAPTRARRAPGSRPPPEPDLLVGDRAYPGSLELHPRSDAGESALDAINVTTLEAYLPGVLTGELLDNWPLEAYRAQAVAARSYALHERARARLRGRAFDLENTARNQVFAGRTQHDAAVRAARDTRGETLTVAGEPLRAYYSSTCGGRPMGAGSIWPTGTGWEFNAAPPLQVDAPRATFCEASSAYRWQVTRTVEDVSRRIAAYGAANGLSIKALGAVRSIIPTEVNAAGRPVRFAIADDKAKTYTLNAEHLRQALNHAADGLPAPERASQVRSGDIEFEMRAREVVIRGRGWGHGVGACQFCMNGMARRHWDYARMLAHFYPGARIERLY
ncbi:MAG: SpoIID/LytB domain-containing protein [Phycisphaerales bacterium]|nr:SpoIID/LytB domain-containing protein [Phycisphaerales bacterium]